MTLAELMAVIGIMVLLLALLFPTTKRLREDSRYHTCISNLHSIGTALSLYRLDESGYPYRDGDYSSGPPASADDLVGCGLRALYMNDYLRNERQLVCPDDIDAPTEAEIAADASLNAQFGLIGYSSYMTVDNNAKASSAVNKVKYRSFRGVDSSDGAYQRQLMRAADPTDASQGPSPHQFDWYPRDDSIVTWCNHHTDFLKRDYKGTKTGEYVVLFVDGSVKTGISRLFTDGAMSPSEAWRVTPSQMEQE